MSFRASAEDTIVAVSTPPGEGGLGVVRLSGPRAVEIAGGFCRRRDGRTLTDQESHTVRLARILGEGSDVIDEALVLVMRAPRSYTAEDTVEISAHGGQAVLSAILDRALRGGARAALPGEFTQRAFLNGRLDLLQAEAVLDLIEAKSERARRWAAAQLEGSLSQRVKDARAGLVESLTQLEASIDFPDDFPETETLSETGRRLAGIRDGLKNLLESAQAGFLAKKGLRTVLWGKPNVGKSSLLNALAGRSRAIVTPFPGTTRDVVEEEISVQGFPLRLCDTAGIQATEHPIEKEGVERSRLALESADLVLAVVDVSRPPDAQDEELVRSARHRPAILVLNKSDLPSAAISPSFRDAVRGMPSVACSCLGSPGTASLEQEIARLLTSGVAGMNDETVVSSVRQKDLLDKAVAALQRACEACSAGLSPDLVSVEVRSALDPLGALVGEVVTDDILESIFSRFCIGK